MPPKIITGPDGQRYYDVPGSDRKFLVDEISGSTEDPNPPRLSDADNPNAARMRGFVQGAKDSPAAKFVDRSAPEIVAGLSAAMVPTTGGMSLAVPPLAAAATDAAQQYFSKGDVDLAQTGTRGALNAIPGVVGKTAGKFLPGSGTLTRALEGASQGEGWIANIARGLKGALGEQAAPAVQIAQAGGKANAPQSALIAQLEAKLQDPRLNTTAKAAALTALRKLQGRQSYNISQGLRGVLGVGEGTLNEGR